MNNIYVAQALEVIDDKNILVNLAAKRASQLNKGERALVEMPRDKNDRPLVLSNLEIALLEIAAKKISYAAIEE